MSNTQQTEAQRLADAIDGAWLENVDPEQVDAPTIQAELRRLDAVEQRHNEMMAHPCPEWDNKAYMLALSSQRYRIERLEAERDQLRNELQKASQP